MGYLDAREGEVVAVEGREEEGGGGVGKRAKSNEVEVGAFEFGPLPCSSGW